MQVIEGVEMVTLSKSDSGFNRFVTGTFKGMRQMTFVDGLFAVAGLVGLHWWWRGISRVR